MIAVKGIKKDYARVEVKSRAALRAWFEKNHGGAESVWIVTYKKAEGAAYVPYEDVRDEALCFGWVDSRIAKVDAARSMLLVSPRKPKSGWSAINKARVKALTEEDRMAPAGLARIEAAKKDGSWTKLDGVETLAEPKDLIAAFRRHAGSKGHWSAFPPSARRGILEWIGAAKRPETRAARVEETARLAAENIRANMPRQPKRA
jgi:uncharacterized protein YdeI (YjbR/CyaY-like superfamily)